MFQVKQLCKSYDSTCVFDHMDFTFPEKGRVCLLGPSGCGKSTLLNILAGFDSNYQGEVLVNGQPLAQMTEPQLCAYRRDTIGFIFQNYCLLAGYTVMENILFPCQLHNIDLDIQARDAHALLDHFG